MQLPRVRSATQRGRERDAESERQITSRTTTALKERGGHLEAGGECKKDPIDSDGTRDV